ncbi:uncharacterized protein LOC119649279 [Hermetia illucens]|uniref:uncharacterized protein LOC119649279 n=1 Tax=Hermetia illucens TaxID=343691 RepID=UPI0018CC0D01|nr:uncharacterized protein LOC119649279 [Hermetia illucens]
MNVSSQLKRRTRRTSEHNSTSRTSEYHRKNCSDVQGDSRASKEKLRKQRRFTISGREARRDQEFHGPDQHWLLLPNIWSFEPDMIQRPMDTRTRCSQGTGEATSVE